MIRLFAALPIPANITEALKPLQKGLSGASWRPVQNFHITIRFFGDISFEMAEELDAAIAEIPVSPLELQLQGCGYFGKREPRAVWARVTENEQLHALSKECERVARRLGLPAEKRPFRPHVTLAYCHGTTPEEAAAYESRHIGFSTGPWTADRFHLYSSRLGNGPSRYIAEADYPMTR